MRLLRVLRLLPLLRLLLGGRLLLRRLRAGPAPWRGRRPPPDPRRRADAAPGDRRSRPSAHVREPGGSVPRAPARGPDTKPGGPTAIEPFGPVAHVRDAEGSLRRVGPSRPPR